MKKLFLLSLMFLVNACASTIDPGSSDANKVAGKTYVVTGASSGFGRGVAEKLGQLHANVVIAAREVPVLNEVAQEIRTSGGQALVVRTDVASQQDMENLSKAAIARFGKVDVWINNAGIGAIGEFEKIPAADYSRLIDVNLKSVVYGSHLALTQFKTQGHGVLINLGSVESEVPLAYHAVYASTKAGILALDQALNQELRLSSNDNINVVTIMPWAVDTPFWKHAENYSGGKPRMAWPDKPEKVIDSIIYHSVYPDDKVPVGWKAESASLSSRIAPDLTNHISANIVHNQQFEKAPPTPLTTGSLYKSNQAGNEVIGGLEQRMEMEDGNSENKVSGN